MKNDFLKECMSDVGVGPIDEFNRAYCVRCVNQQCARSASNNHAFVKRTNSWKERLFTEVARASDDDPQYAQIRANSFISRFQNGGSVNTPVEAEAPQEIAVVAFDEVPQAIEKPISEAAPKPLPKPPVPVAAPVNLPPTVVRNTPFEQGVMLPGAGQPVIQPGDTVFFDDE